ncbi:Conserved putative secreted protein [Amycolatopsis japonica]|uniref:Conserved putative secreted protein n=1 Tax=Amycolatopsis japonica TaxID=208439 RepID=A0A075UYI8_9PSEU|nr:DUF6153 family protein [Amycolatopsis japonica]AIG75235.1 Conserved putative secreted protein [Amycolatopsis japonica]
MTQSSCPATLRWLLLCVVALGLVGMHHVVAESGHGTGHSVVAMADPCCADTPSHDDGGHNGLHLCLAVLAAGVLLIVTWLLVRNGRTVTTWKSRRAAGSASGRDPPRWRPVPEKLSFLCVLRV